MNKLNKNENGFSAVEFVILLIIAVLVGAVGYFVYENHHKVIQKSSTVTKTVTTPAKSSSETKTYTDTAANSSFTYPGTWTLTSIKGQCGEPDGCAPSTDKISAVKLTSPDNQFTLVWSGISGIGGSCDNTISAIDGGCAQITVFSSEPVPKASGLYVVEGAIQQGNSQYTPFMAIQDSNGVLKSGQLNDLFYQTFNLPSTTNITIFNMNNGYKDGGGIRPASFSSISQSQAYLNTSNAKQAAQILSSLNVH